MIRRLAAFALAVFALLAAGVPARGQERYHQPPAPVPQILAADLVPLASPSPDGRLVLLLEREGLPSIEDVAGPERRLAGRRVNPVTNGPSRTFPFKGLRIVSVATGRELRVEVPAGAHLANVEWSADSAEVAFTVTSADGIALWAADAATGRSRRLTEARLNAAAGAPCAWISRLDGFVCRMIPADRKAALPQAATTPEGPVVQETRGKAAPAPTFQDLLQDAADEAQFEYLFRSQLVRVGPDGVARPVGAPGLHVASRPSPDGRFLLVETVHRPFSYLVPMNRFPRLVEIWDQNGTLVRRVADVPLQEEVPLGFDAVPTGPREVAWRADAPATLAWVEALDGGDPRRAAEKRDRIFTMTSPFAADPGPLFDAAARIRDITWGRGDLALVQESWWKTRRTRTWAVSPDARDRASRLLLDVSSEDRYADPGDFATHIGPLGTPVLLASADGKSLFLLGAGASPEGDRPFVDRFDLAAAKSTRLWRSETKVFEEAIAILDGAGRRLLTRRESPTEVPNLWLRDGGGAPRRLTDFPDPAPAFAGVAPELVKYKRADGLELSARVFLPPGYAPAKGPLPFLLWVYPEEFKSAAAAAQVTGSPYRFTRPSGPSPLFALLFGYGVLDNPAMPIVGEGDREPNDTYVDQLVSDARAAVDAIVAMGVADRARLAIGGHSYGAFTTANLLAHSDLFKAGIARSGAYNRTLTPFGFQAEERPFWKARETYIAMSPFTFADKINEPILLIHGMADNNQGTFPIQSERLYAAIKGNGGTARLVMLPAEAHGYRARESVGDVVWEMLDWLDTHVR